MKYKFFLLFFLTFFFKVNSQNYTATYKVRFKTSNYDSLFKHDKKFKKYTTYRNALKEQQQRNISLSKIVEFKLKFNTKESMFSTKEILENSQRGLKVFMINAGVKGKYYSTLQNTLHQKDSYGQLFLINIPKPEWKITNVSRKIGKYLCYKATTIKKVSNSRGVHNINITAWFAPELPYNFGPKEFSGLPGLIVEVKEGKKQLNLIKIAKSKQEKTFIKKLTKGKKLDLFEFNKLSKRMYESMRSSQKRKRN